jgi:hypothetical protein
MAAVLMTALMPRHFLPASIAFDECGAEGRRRLRCSSGKVVHVLAGVVALDQYRFLFIKLAELEVAERRPLLCGRAYIQAGSAVGSLGAARRSIARQ